MDVDEKFRKQERLVQFLISFIAIITSVRIFWWTTRYFFDSVMFQDNFSRLAFYENYYVIESMFVVGAVFSATTLFIIGKRLEYDQMILGVIIGITHGLFLVYALM